MKGKDKNTNNFLAIILLFVVFLSLGYALLGQELNTTGVTNFDNASWSIHFVGSPTDSFSEASVSVVGTHSYSSDYTSLSFSDSLSIPGDFYEFTVDIVNDGTMDAMINSFQILPTLTAAEQEYFDYIITYSDGIEVDNYHLLEAGDTETLRVAFIYKIIDDTSLYPTEDEDYTISLTINYVQADDNAFARPVPPPEPKSCAEFTNDSWETVVTNAQGGQLYEVGCTKEVVLGNSLGTHTIRVANNTTPAECSTEGFSQTACGFVLEFADIITTHVMNSTETNVHRQSQDMVPRIRLLLFQLINYIY